MGRPCLHAGSTQGKTRARRVAFPGAIAAAMGAHSRSSRQRPLTARPGQDGPQLSIPSARDKREGPGASVSLLEWASVIKHPISVPTELAPFTGCLMAICLTPGRGEPGREWVSERRGLGVRRGLGTPTVPGSRGGQARAGAMALEGVPVVKGQKWLCQRQLPHPSLTSEDSNCRSLCPHWRAAQATQERLL